MNSTASSVTERASSVKKTGVCSKRVRRTGMCKSELALRSLLCSLSSFAESGEPGADRARSILWHWDKERGTCKGVFPSCAEPEVLSDLHAEAGLEGA